MAAALTLADDRGDFSMRALGSQLRVDPMAIYRHFPDKEALLDAMVDAALTGFEPPQRESGTPAELLRQMCIELRSVVARHPGIARRASTARLTLGPHSLELTDAALGLLREMGLTPRDADLAYLALIRFVSGTSSAEDQVRAAGQTEKDWHEEMRKTHETLPLADFTHVAEIARTLPSLGFDEQFLFGIDALLAGLAAKARPSGSPG